MDDDKMVMAVDNMVQECRGLKLDDRMEELRREIWGRVLEFFFFKQKTAYEI